MKPERLPDTIQSIISQAGGLGMQGAFVYVGAGPFSYSCPQPEGECRPDKQSWLALSGELGSVEFEVGLAFRVNGRRGRNWTMVVAYEPDDTYTVWLTEGHPARRAESMVLACHRDVHCDTLQSVIEGTYDEAIQTHNDGVIPI